MNSFQLLFFAPSRAFVVVSPLDAEAAAHELAVLIDRPSAWRTAVPGTIVGEVSGHRLTAHVASGMRNAWRSVASAQIAPRPDGGSTISGTVGTSRAVNAFTAFWLVGALGLTGFLVIVSLVGLVAGTPTMRDGSGRPTPPIEAVIVSVGAFLLFCGAGIVLPWFGRRLSAGDPDRLIEFVVQATRGSLEG